MDTNIEQLYDQSHHNVAHLICNIVFHPQSEAIPGHADDILKQQNWHYFPTSKFAQCQFALN